MALTKRENLNGIKTSTHAVFDKSYNAGNDADYSGIYNVRNAIER